MLLLATVTTLLLAAVSSSTSGAVDNEVVPIFPRATDLHTEAKWGKDWEHTVYSTTATAPEVLTFYRERMKMTGWDFQKETASSASEYYQVYWWEDPEGTRPWDMRLTIRIVDPRGTGGLENTIVDSGTARVPLLDKVPIFPAAEQITESRSDGKVSPLPNEPQLVENAPKDQPLKRVVSYYVNATMPDIERYYRELLPTHGWTLIGDSSENIAQGLLFEYGYGGPESYFSNEVRISATMGTDERTHVIMNMEGNIEH